MFILFVFVNTDLRSLTITCIIYTCYKYLACDSKMASILNLVVGRSMGCPLNCPLFPYLEVVGYPLSCPLSCPLYPYMAVVGSLICMAKFPWAAHGQPTPLPRWAAHFFMFGSSGLPTVSIYGSSGQPNLHGKIPMGSPRAANSLATCSPRAAKWAAPLFFPYGAFCHPLLLNNDKYVNYSMTGYILRLQKLNLSFLVETKWK